MAFHVVSTWYGRTSEDFVFWYRYGKKVKKLMMIWHILVGSTISFIDYSTSSSRWGIP